MKKSRKYAEKIRKLFNALKREYGKPVKTAFEEPTDALIYAIVSEDLTESATHETVKRLREHFVDWNDLRASREDEIVEVLGKDLPETRAKASKLTAALYSIFNKYDVVSLGAIKQMNKKPAKQVLQKLDSVNRFTVNYVMLTALQGHAIPLTPRMIEYLRSKELVDPEADEEDIEGFLERQISAAQAYDFYALLRRESEKAAPRTKKTVHAAKIAEKTSSKEPAPKSASQNEPPGN